MQRELSPVSIAVFTEDTSPNARETIETLVRRMLRLAAPGCRADRVAFLPDDAKEREQVRRFGGTVWKTDGKSPQEREKRMELLRWVARQLALTNTFVAFHIDADVPFSTRETSENRTKFEARFLIDLRHMSQAPRASVTRARRRLDASDAPATVLVRLDHLILLCPHPSIESWTYQNVKKALEICRREHHGHDLDELRKWEANRDTLDETERVHKQVCLGKTHNLELAKEGFPAREVYDVEKSFFESVERIKSCGDLGRALMRENR